jgi:CubicO group peptidase (beta-lactamase class C family)
MQLFLNRGRHKGRQIVSERTIDLMISNQIGPLTVQAIDSADGLVARTFPEGAGKDGFGFGFEIETPPSAPGRRSPGTLSWAGIFNTHFWIDPARGVAAAVLMQMLPANDPAVVDLLTAFERTVYDRLR